MTKSQALRLYKEAELFGNWEEAAHALAAALSPPKKAQRSDINSKAFRGLRLVKWTVCREGHEFNAAGCKICQYCTHQRWRDQGRPFVAASYLR